MRTDPKKQEAFAAAKRRFPQLELPIRRLIETSDDFREVCEELADAERALVAAASATDAARVGTQAEWQELVDRLVAEVELAIRPLASAGGGDADRTLPRN